MLDSTAEREAWEREVGAVVDRRLDERVSKAYSFYSVSPDDLVTGRQLQWLEASIQYASERLHDLETWRDTRWHTKAGRAIVAAWKGWGAAAFVLLSVAVAGYAIGQLIEAALAGAL